MKHPRQEKKSKREIPYRLLGHTGEKVSIVGLGGHHIGIQKDEQESIRLIRTAIDNGINFMDNSWDYNDGVSEIRMGKALQDGYRKTVFLMTTIDRQGRKTAMKQIEEYLRCLQKDENFRPSGPLWGLFYVGCLGLVHGLVMNYSFRF